MGKILWIDTETTGVDPKVNSMVQLAALVEIDGRIKEKINLLFQPLPGRQIHPKAIEVNGRDEKELVGFPPARISILALKARLKKYINPYDKTDKFVAAGYNVDFDTGFLRETWFASGGRFGPGSWIFNVSIDVRTRVAERVAKECLRLPNYKLTTVCENFGVDLACAHDAMSDIEATRELYYKL